MIFSFPESLNERKERKMMSDYSHNPLLDSGIFVPDVEAHAWEDGRISVRLI